MVTKHGLDRRRIFITGLSAGGAMAAAMLATYPEVFAGGAIIAGLAYGSASTIPEAFDRMRGHGGPSKAELQRRLAEASPHKGTWPKISIWQGTADTTVVAVQRGFHSRPMARGSRRGGQPHPKRNGRWTDTSGVVRCGRQGVDREIHHCRHGPWHALKTSVMMAWALPRHSCWTSEYHQHAILRISGVLQSN